MLILINIDDINVDQRRRGMQGENMTPLTHNQTDPSGAEQPDRSTTTFKAPPGLKGLEVAETNVGTVRGDAGLYHYRGHNAAEFSRHASFEGVVALLHDAPATGSNDIEVQRMLGAGRASVAPDAIGGWWHNLNGSRPRETTSQTLIAPLVAALLATVDNRPTTDMTADERRAACVQAIAIAPTVLAGSWRRANDLDPLPADPGAGHAADYVQMITGRTPLPVVARAVEVYLNLTAEHGFNASTFATRVITSTGGSVPFALSGGIGALLGPLHGGAPSRVLDMINAIGDPTNAEQWAQSQLDAGHKLMGFGHAVYRVADPRSAVLKSVAGAMPGSDAQELLARADEIEQRIHTVLKRHRPGNTFITNVEYYAAIALFLAGIPQEMFTATFIVSRLVGWTAHLLEQADNNKIMRPSARYVGPVVDIPR